MTQLEPLPEAGKPAVASMTIWGASAALLGILAPPLLARLGVTAADAQEAAKDLGDLIAAAGSLVAIYGRTVAARPITSILKKEA